MDLISCYLLLVTGALSVACTMILWFPSTPSIVSGLTLYGKTTPAGDSMPLVQRVSVPKRWFTHFYILAVIWTGFWLEYALAVSYGYTSPTKWQTNALAVLTRTKPHYSWTTGMLALILIMIHVTRRCQESLFVSIFSNATMNVAHYVIGITHYIVLPLTVVSEMIGIASTRKMTSLNFDFLEITITQWAGVVIFLFCNWQQNSIAHRLASARRGATGLVHNYGHCVYRGGWFDYVSSPHFTFEVLIYLGLWLVLGVHAVTFKMLVMFVCVNQMFAAMITHRWYKANFKNYPPERRAIIPYVL
ncbi:unnamed protein product, partial [Mesorhabditis belari]|uniref:Polyprenal reductase n=1 Tax=Mesorhabditis belari TaxID=2138241 RepID=A0AAF3J7B2_9BILA